MSAERGIVENVGHEWALVNTKRSSACASFSSRHHCSMVEGGDQMLVKAQNTAKAKKGDEVELYLSTKTKLKCTAIVYLLLVFGIFLGAFSANLLSDAMGFNPSLGMVLFTLAGLVSAVFFMRYLANRMASKQALTLLVKRVIMKNRYRPTERF